MKFPDIKIIRKETFKAIKESDVIFNKHFDADKKKIRKNIIQEISNRSKEGRISVSFGYKDLNIECESYDYYNFMDETIIPELSTQGYKCSKLSGSNFGDDPWYSISWEQDV